MLLALLLVVVAIGDAMAAPDPQSATDAQRPTGSSTLIFDDNASTDELVESAREMFIADNYELAEMLYKSVLVREPNHLPAMLELAIIYETTGQLQYARGLLTRALVIRPHDEEIIQRNTEIVRKLSLALETEVESLIAIGAYEQALPKLAVLLTTQPENSDLNYKKAICHLELGQLDAAMVELDQALRLAREDRYYDLKAKVSAAGERDEIGALVEQAKKALRAGTANAKEAALRSITRILELDPENQWAKEQFLALTEGQPSGLRLEGWDISGRLVAWGVPLKQALARAGNGLLLLATVLADHIEVLLTILLALLVFSSPLTHLILRGFSPRQSLSGRLDHFSIHELLTLINTHHRSGELILKTPSGSGRVYFDGGEIYHCKSRGASGRTALQNLIRHSVDGFFLFKDGVSSKEDTIDTPLSLILLELPERVDSVTSQSILQKQKQQSKMKSLLSKEP
jgi:tetratricopeptide (TPR) repeat protein